MNVSDTVGAAGVELATSDFETIFEAHYGPVARAIAASFVTTAARRNSLSKPS